MGHVLYYCTSLYFGTSGIKNQEKLKYNIFYEIKCHY